MKKKKNILILKFLYKYINFIYFCIKFLFQDLQTGQTVIMTIYIRIHIILSDLQLQIFYLKSAYKKGKLEKNRKLGIYYI